VARSKLTVARHLRRLANRLDPSHPLVYEVDSYMTAAGAKAFADTASWQFGSQIGVSYVRPDGMRTRT
jgi:hypothetical protein